MEFRLFWRSLAVQTLAVLALFICLLPLGKEFFRSYGFAAGPLAWAVCSVLTARVLRLPVLRTVGCALAGGIAGLVVLLTVGHTPAMAAAVVVFAALVGSVGRERAATAA